MGQPIVANGHNPELAVHVTCAWQVKMHDVTTKGMEGEGKKIC